MPYSWRLANESTKSARLSLVRTYLTISHTVVGYSLMAESVKPKPISALDNALGDALYCTLFKTEYLASLLQEANSRSASRQLSSLAVKLMSQYFEYKTYKAYFGIPLSPEAPL